jgi:pimeloyl-ACP methyl ester carboxylesterase
VQSDLHPSSKAIVFFLAAVAGSIRARVTYRPLRSDCPLLNRVRAVPHNMSARRVPKTLAVPGGMLAYDEEGAGQPIVLLHEGIADRRMWAREFATLSRRNHVVRYDLRGFGGSTPASGPYSPVADLVALLDHVRMNRPLIVGPSMGGRIALDLTLAHPNRVGGLLLVAPAYSGMDYDHVPGGRATFEPDERLSRAATDAWRAGRLEEATECLRELWAGVVTGPALDLFRVMVRENAEEVFADRSAQFETREGGPAAERLKEIRASTWILVGNRDNPTMPHLARFLARGIAGSRLEVVTGADHLLNLSRPDAFDAALQEIMDSLPDR